MTKKTGCAIGDCDRPHYCRDWCVPHYQRWKQYGDPLAGPPMRARRGTGTGSTSRPTPEYYAKHRLVRESRGPAWQQPCYHCGAEEPFAGTALCPLADDWATIHGMDGSQPDHYVPLCRRHHILYDGQVRNLPDNWGSKRTPEQKARMSQAAKDRWADPVQVELARKNAIAREARKRASRNGTSESS